MANRRGTATTQRQPQRVAQNEAAAAEQRSAEMAADPTVVDFLTEGGWSRGEDGSWTHETKAGGHPLDTEQAFGFEGRARDAAARENESEADRQAREAAEREATEREAFIANRTAEEGRRAAAEEQARLDRIAQIEHEEAIAEDVPVHDMLGQVMLWSCYACRFGCRYSPACTCETCAKITEAIGCPNCGDEQPNVDPRRR